MNIKCPQCQAELQLPDDSFGKKARCPSCEFIFVIGADEKSEQVQAGLPATPPAPVLPTAPSNDENRDRPRRRRFEDDDDDIATVGRDTAQVATQAKAAARPAGWMMLLATGALFLNFVLGVTMFFVSFDQPENQAKLQEIGKIAPGIVRALPVMVPTCVCAFYAPFVLFMLLGGRSLLVLGSRGIIITGIVFSFIMAFLEGVGLISGLSNLARQAAPQQPITNAIVGLGMTLLCFMMTLTAAVMAVRALGHPDIIEFYRLQFEEEMEHRGRRRRGR